MKKGLILLFLVFILAGFWFTKNKFQNTQPIKQKSTSSSKIILTYSFVKANQLPVIVAQEKGFFKKYSLDVNIHQVNKNVTSVIASGKADIMIGTPNVALVPAIQGANLSWVGNINNDQTAVIVSSKSNKDIKNVGVVSGPDKIQSIGLLSLLGLDTNKLVFQELSDNQTKLIAFKEKQIDAIYIAKPDWIIFQRKANLSDEYKVILDSSNNKVAQTPISLIVYNKFLKENKVVVENFAKAIIEANYWIEQKNNKEEFTKLLGKHFNDIPEDDVKVQADVYIGTLKNLQFSPTLEKGKEILKFIEASNPKAKDYDLNNFINTGISDSLKQSGFLSKFEFK